MTHSLVGWKSGCFLIRTTPALGPSALKRSHGGPGMRTFPWLVAPLADDGFLDVATVEAYIMPAGTQDLTPVLQER